MRREKRRRSRRADESAPERLQKGGLSGMRAEFTQRGGMRGLAWGRDRSVCVCACVRACVLACVRACLRARVVQLFRGSVAGVAPEWGLRSTRLISDTGTCKRTRMQAGITYPPTTDHRRIDAFSTKVSSQQREWAAQAYAHTHSRMQAAPPLPFLTHRKHWRINANSTNPQIRGIWRISAPSRANFILF